MTSFSERRICPELPIGEMPIPRLTSEYDESGLLSYHVEIKSYSVSGECIDFRFVRNIGRNIDNPDHRKVMARIAAQLQHFSRISIAYGPAIHKTVSLNRRQIVPEVNPDVTGLYVHREKYEEYLTMAWKNSPSINTLFRKDIDLAWSLIDAASTVLPKRRVSQ